MKKDSKKSDKYTETQDVEKTQDLEDPQGLEQDNNPVTP